MSKKILYIDLDGVVADFDRGLALFMPEINTLQDPIDRKIRIDEILDKTPSFFQDLPLIDGAKEYVTQLFMHFETYFLSTAPWKATHSLTGKRIWVEKHFGNQAEKRLILTHRKDLNIGDFLVDDRIKNGSENFRGEHIHFATPKFPNWEIVYHYLISKK